MGIRKTTPFKFKLLLCVVLVLGVALLAAWYLGSHNIAVLNPKGIIASQQRDLILFTVLLSLIVVVPVFVMVFTFAWKYRAGNSKARYAPDWDHHKIAEAIWWVVPLILISIVAVITWKSSHDLDPFKPINTKTRPVTIQVVALQWKWLFIYPEYDVASVNFVQFPVDTPVNFEVTADAPMNSFWIPQLGGQIYAMAGMKTQLHLMADETGSYYGSSANISGEGFAGMKFTAKASTLVDFTEWVRSAKQAQPLALAEYNKLALPSKNNSVTYYSLKERGLYDEVVNKYMAPTPFDHEVSDINKPGVMHYHE